MLRTCVILEYDRLLQKCLFESHEKSSLSLSFEMFPCILGCCETGFVSCNCHCYSLCMWGISTDKRLSVIHLNNNAGLRRLYIVNIYILSLLFQKEGTGTFPLL